VTPGVVVVFEGTCDASGAVALDDHRFAVADDENNVLRVYDAERGGLPLWSHDLTVELELGPAAEREVDLEAAASIGDRAFWLSSHGRTKQGGRVRSRLMLFATDLPHDDPEMELEGRVYRTLLRDLLADPRYQRFKLAEAAQRAPQEPGGLNIEGMTETPDGRLLLGMRNPIPEGRALFAVILNPLELAEDEGAVQRARLGDPFTLDLDGRGVRGLALWHGEYLILGGSYTHQVETQLFHWDGKGDPRRVEVDLLDFNPETFFTAEARKEIMILSDDGEVEIDGALCKKLRDPAKKRFRGIWVRP